MVLFMLKNNLFCFIINISWGVGHPMVKLCYKPEITVKAVEIARDHCL